MIDRWEKAKTAALLLLAAGVLVWLMLPAPREIVPAGREEVLFWHFWSGEDRAVVDQVVARFNRSQDQYQVRAVAMPGNNLDLKVFLAVTGGDPPDVINQDDPIVADWAARGALTPLEELASSAERIELDEFLVPAARRLGSYEGKLYALCNGLDIRALYYNQTILDEAMLAPPEQLADLDRIARETTRRSADGRLERVGYLPNPHRLWAWGAVFGGSFYDDQRGRVTADSEPIVAALEWMVGYREWLGPQALAAFRQADQSLPGKPFPLLAGRYTAIMDGQWRIRDIRRHQQQQRDRGEPVTQFGACPLPAPPGGTKDAGWVNGNFFIVPRGARQPQGAWAFMKFWVGLAGQESEAASTCIQGGWIPVSRRVAEQPEFRDYLKQEPLMATFVELAGSPAQMPTPVIPGAPRFKREIEEAADRALLEVPGQAPRQLLRAARSRIQAHLQRFDEAPR